MRRCGFHRAAHELCSLIVQFVGRPWLCNVTVDYLAALTFLPVYSQPSPLFGVFGTTGQTSGAFGYSQPFGASPQPGKWCVLYSCVNVTSTP